MSFLAKLLCSPSALPKPSVLGDTQAAPEPPHQGGVGHRSGIAKASLVIGVFFFNCVEIQTYILRLKLNGGKV